MRKILLPLLYLLCGVGMLVLPRCAMAGWYLDSIKTASVIEIRGESADTTVAKAAGDRYVEDNLDYVLANNEWVAINFCAYWCGDCNNFTPAFQKASTQPEYAKIRWAHADLDGVRGNENLRKRFNLPGTPTVILFHEGQIVRAPDGTPMILDGHEGDKTYDDLVAYLTSYYKPH
jgi:thioredoxin 1